MATSLGKKGELDVVLIDANRTHIWKPHLHEVAAGIMDSNKVEAEALRGSFGRVCGEFDPKGIHWEQYLSPMESGVSLSECIWSSWRSGAHGDQSRAHRGAKRWKDAASEHRCDLPIE